MTSELTPLQALSFLHSAVRRGDKWDAEHDIAYRTISVALQAAPASMRQIAEALTIAEDILSRSPHSTQIAANGMHPQIVIEKIRGALETALSQRQPMGETKP